MEEGWIFLGLCMLFLLFLLRDHRVLLWQKLCQSRHLQFIASLSFLLLVESALQFPFEMALTYLCISMVCGYMLSVLPVGRSLSFLSLFSVPLFLAFFALLGCLLAGDIIYGSFKDKHSSLFGCRLSPYHKRLCHRSLQYIARQNPSAAIPLLKKELEKVPYSFVTLYELGRAYYMTGQHEKSCRVNVFYDRLFHRKSVLHSFTQKHCLGYELNKCEEVF